MLVSSDYTLQQIEVEWEEPEDDGGSDITSYDIWIDDGAGTWGSAISSASVTPPLTYTFSNPTVVAGGTYQVKVQAVNLVGSSEESDTSTFECASIPDAPTSIILEASTSESLTISWSVPASDGGSDITGYLVYMSDIQSEDFDLVYNGLYYPSTLTFQVTGLIEGIEYRFKVSALNNIGASLNSTEETFIARDLPDAPS